MLYGVLICVLVALSGAPVPRVATHSSKIRNLQSTRVTPKYREQLTRHVVIFDKWCRANGHRTYKHFIHRPKKLNSLLVEFIQELFACDYRISIAEYVLLGLHFEHRELRRNLREAWDSVQSWRLEVPVQVRVPMDPVIFKVIFIHIILMGFTASKRVRHKFFRAAMGLAAGFAGLLRPREWCGTRRRHITVSSEVPWKTPRSAIISIKDLKNKQFLGTWQFCIIDLSWVVDWLIWITTDLPPETLVILSYEATRRIFIAALSELRLCFLKYIMGSLRAGRATQLFQQTRNLPQLQYAGRWQNLN